MNMQSQKGNTTFYTCTLFNLNSFFHRSFFAFNFLRNAKYKKKSQNSTFGMPNRSSPTSYTERVGMYIQSKNKQKLIHKYVL